MGRHVRTARRCTQLLKVEKEILDGLHIQYRVVENARRRGLSQVRPGGLDACPWRLWRGDQRQQLHGLSGAPSKIGMRSASTGKSLSFVHTLPKFRLQKELNSRVGERHG